MGSSNMDRHKTNRREFIAGSLALGLTAATGKCLSGCNSPNVAAKPNIIIITTHDTGCHFGCYGAKGVTTPAIDQLAAEGVMFTQMHSPSPMCSPSRGALLTGRWPDRNGLLGLAGHGWHYELNNRKEHLSYVLQQQGYYTALFGHQHETLEDSNLGFDHVFGLENEGVKRTAPQITSAAADFLRSSKAKKKPFYLQVGFFETHTPFMWGGLKACPEEQVNVPSYTEYSDDKELNEYMAEFQASVNRVDEAVANITTALEQTGLDESTLIVFTVDHGPELPRAKWTMFDAGTRIAFIVRWPKGGIQGGKAYDQLLCNVDFLATLQELTGIKIPHEMDGMLWEYLEKSDSPILRGQVEHPFHRELREEYLSRKDKWGQSWKELKEKQKSAPMKYTVATEGYKLIVDFQQSSLSNSIQLYDLQKDSECKNNLANNAEYNDTFDQMKEYLWSWLEAEDDPVLTGPLPPCDAWKQCMRDYEVWKKQGRPTS